VKLGELHTGAQALAHGPRRPATLTSRSRPGRSPSDRGRGRSKGLRLYRSGVERLLACRFEPPDNDELEALEDEVTGLARQLGNSGRGSCPRPRAPRSHPW